jgi:hypothetical protein
MRRKRPGGHALVECRSLPGVFRASQQSRDFWASQGFDEGMNVAACRVDAQELAPRLKQRLVRRPYGLGKEVVVNL